MDLETIYEQQKKLITKTVFQFRQKYGGDFHDLLSEAHEFFILACRDHKPEKSKLSTWVRNRIWWGLLSNKTYIVRKFKNRKNLILPLKTDPQHRDHFDLEMFIGSNLSPEAGRVARTALKFRKRSSLVNHLMQEGWTTKEIMKIFLEIQEALK